MLTNSDKNYLKQLLIVRCCKLEAEIMEIDLCSYLPYTVKQLMSSDIQKKIDSLKEIIERIE